MRPSLSPMRLVGTLGWGLSLTLLVTSGSFVLDAAESARRPARLQPPQNARPLPPRVEYAESREYGDELHHEREMYEEDRAEPAPVVARPASAQRVVHRPATSRPAVVQLTLLDDGPSQRETVNASGRYDRRNGAARRGDSSVNRVGYQDRAWTRRSDGHGDEHGFVHGGHGEVRRIESSSHAFDDPFGDRRSAARPMTLAPARGNYPVQDAGTSGISSRSRSTGAAFWQDGSSDCERTYNDRNCCDDDAVCRQARQRLLRSPISKISLDISPRFNPTTQETGRLPDRERTFEDDLRSWRDRDGQLVAQGALIGIENGRVLIRRDNGSIARVPVRQLSDDDMCYFAAWWGVPNVCALGDEQYADRHFAPLTMTWKASALCHKPLYFEEVQLERYGHTTGPFIQPALSGAHFFLNVAALPYRAGINPPNECLYSLGYYRPGSCAPWMVPPIPLSVRGALLQAGTVVGGAALIP